MTFPRILGLASLFVAAQAFAQSEPTVAAVQEEAAAPVTELTEAHARADAGNAAAGQDKAAVCAACHGMDGNSIDPQYPKLAGQHERYIAHHLALYKSGERPNPIMLGFSAALSPQDMRDIGAYYATQTMLPGVADESVVQDGPYQGRKFYEIGQQLYRGGDEDRAIPACAACHGPTGLGNPGPAYPALAGQHAQYTAQILRQYREGAVFGDGEHAAVMAGVAARLTDQEIDALASYLEGLHAAPRNGRR